MQLSSTVMDVVVEDVIYNIIAEDNEYRGSLMVGRVWGMYMWL